MGDFARCIQNRSVASGWQRGFDMFYSQLVLTKRGPLGRIWLAAHWQKKLTKSQVNGTNILQSVDAIAKPDVPLALRTSGHLLLGIVRIFERQAKYLLIDCGDALQKFKQAFRTGQGELDPKQASATFDTVTLPTEPQDHNPADELEDFVVGSLPSNCFFDVDSTQARREDITLQENINPLSSKALSRSNSVIEEEMFDMGRGDVLAFQGSSAPSPARSHAELDMTDLSPEILRDHDDVSVGLVDMDDMDDMPHDDAMLEDFELERGTPGSQSSRRMSAMFSKRSDIDEEEEIDYGMPQVGKVQLKRSNNVLIDEETQIAPGDIREMLKDTSDILAPNSELFINTPSSRRKRIRVVPPKLREPMVNDFPAAVYTMILNKFSAAPVPPVEKPRQAPTHRAVDTWGHDGGASPSRSPDRQPEFDEPHMMDGDDMIGDAYGSGLQDELVEDPQDFDIPVAQMAEAQQNESELAELDNTESGLSPQPAAPTSDMEEDEDSNDGFTGNTRAVAASLEDLFGDTSNPKVSLRELVETRLENTSVKKNRVAAQTFYEMLVLKSKGFLHLEQSAPYEDISILPRDKFSELKI